MPLCIIHFTHTHIYIYYTNHYIHLLEKCIFWAIIYVHMCAYAYISIHVHLHMHMYIPQHRCYNEGTLMLENDIT
jgi:hypothetical protein